MRNLLGRLNARTLPELVRIADAWHLPPVAVDRSTLIASLFREMRDIRTLRDLWQKMDDDQRSLVSLLVIAERSPDAALTLLDIATALATTTDEAHQIAAELYRMGIVAREGDAATLPIGVEPELFVPTELSIAFNRLFEEMDAGDRSNTLFAQLLKSVDDSDLETALLHWGANIIPGLRTPGELIQMLNERLTDSSRFALMTAGMPPLARTIWQGLKADEAAGPMPLDTIITVTGLDVTQAHQAAELREALEYLETRLLVWHCYDQQRDRQLFIPSQIQDPDQASATGVPVLESVEGNVRPDAALLTEHSVAWDLLTVLRAIDDPERPHLRDVRRASNHWRTNLNRSLWNRGELQPPPGYLEFLAALAASAGIYLMEDPAASSLASNPAMREWRAKSFTEQTRHLQWSWLANPAWIEASDGDVVLVQGAVWPAYRRRLLSRLQLLDPHRWYDIDAVARWCAVVDPEMLGPTAVAATGRAYDTGSDELSRRRVAVTAATEQTLLTACRWLGLIQTGTSEHGQQVIRVTALAAALARPDMQESELKVAHGMLQVTPDQTIVLHVPSPLQVWACSAFAIVETLADPAVYRMSQQMIRRAIAAGNTTDQIISFLEQQSNGKLPTEVDEQIQEWAKTFRAVSMRDVILLQGLEKDQYPIVREKIRQDFLVIDTDRGILVGPSDSVPFAELHGELEQLLSSLGFSVKMNPLSSVSTGLTAETEDLA